MELELKLVAGKTMVSDLNMKLMALGMTIEKVEAKKLITAATAIIHAAAVDRCPYDSEEDGVLHLEEAIEMKVQSGFTGEGGGKQGYYGRIFINKTGDTGKYAVKMHEGVYKIGKDSKLKASARRVNVGRKFIEHAFADKENEVEALIVQGIARAIKQANSGNAGGGVDSNVGKSYTDSSGKVWKSKGSGS